MAILNKIKRADLLLKEIKWKVSLKIQLESFCHGVVEANLTRNHRVAD